MSRYRRATATGSSYFFTVIAYRRQPILCSDAIRNALRTAIETVHVARPFDIDDWVLLSDHLHCVWTLPGGDADFSNRWMKIKRAVSLTCGEEFHRIEWMRTSKSKHRESTIWQRRFWEHQIRDEDDFARHIDYIHFNLVKHGHVQHASDWPYSTFHRYVRDGLYARDWAGAMDGVEYD
jgi:putative transposase